MSAWLESQDPVVKDFLRRLEHLLFMEVQMDAWERFYGVPYGPPDPAAECPFRGLKPLIEASQ